tara:strand:- start:1479 stop:2210 length:732 start_codon:yes stop_codon:yes gene_type:complete
MNKISGFGVTEQLISILISSIILMCLVQFYLSFKKFFFLYHMKAQEFSENILISELIRNRIQHAGFTPCMNVKHLISTNIFDDQKPIRPFTVQMLPSPQLTIERMSENYDHTTIVDSRHIIIDNNQFKLKKNDKILIADCFHCETASVQSLKKSKGQSVIELSHALAHRYQGRVYVGSYLKETFYLSTLRGYDEFRYDLDRSEVLSDSMTTFQPIHVDQNEIIIRMKFKNDKKNTEIRAFVRS